MTEGQGLEGVPGAEIVRSVFAHEDHVFVPDAVHAFAVEARFDGVDDARDIGIGIEVLAEFLRAFMDIEEEADAVAGAVAEVALGLPEGVAGQDVQVAAAGAHRERCA